MLKPMIAGATLLAIAGSSFVYAQQGFGGRGYDGYRAEPRYRMSIQDRAAFADARIAALRAGLQLTPDQAKNWPPFEQAVRDLVQLRLQRLQARQAALQQSQNQTQNQGQPTSTPSLTPTPTPAPAPTPTTPFDRLAQRAEYMAKASTALKRIADTGAPLYQSLDDAQKARFTILARMLRPHPHHGMRGEDGRGWRQGGWGDRDGRDFGRDGRGWGHGRRFGEEGHGLGERTHGLMGNDTDEGEQL